MAHLKYKTRGMSSPQNKPRVYFCCHPEDFGLYFDSVSDEILEKQDCAVWYPEPQDAHRDEDFLEDLKQMQLFVMPITTRLLCSQNHALEVEFPFAVKNHIPVLPLMQEGSLEEWFRRKCGDLQFLDRHSTDLTAISYDEKLEKYLSNVLIGDTLAEKIRAAFDAYVFLSYRKKDRKYARELMRLIHKNDFCRDLAIWYDEFLTPGEDFNDAIKAALRKSSLFVLAVTPNLVNEINYILTTEYPIARQEGKPILPVELVPTDRNQLTEKYKNIPPCTNAYDGQALAQALLASLEHIVFLEKDASAEHTFFIGLAYLSGVDVEVDHEIALALITSAANAGLVEAMDKLAQMYSNGIGVQTDHSRAMYWRDKRLAVFLEQYANEQTKETGLDLFWEYTNCASAYLTLYNTQKANCYFEKAKDYLCWFDETEQKTERLLLELNRILSLREEIPAAEVLARVKNGIAPFRQGDLSQTECRLLLLANTICGSVCANELQSHEAAKEHFEQVIALSHAHAENIGEEDSVFFLRIGLDGAANAFTELGHVDEALQARKECLQISEHRAAVLRTADALGDVIDARLNLVYLYTSFGEPAKALAELPETLHIAEELHASQNTAYSGLRLLRVYNQLGLVYTSEWDAAQAEHYFNLALQLGEQLKRLIPHSELDRRIAITHMNLGNLYTQTENGKPAAPHYESAEKILQNVLEQKETPERLVNLANVYVLAGAHWFHTDLSESRACYEKGQHLLEKRLNTIDSVLHQLLLKDCYIGLSDICNENGDPEGTENYLQLACQLTERLTQKTDSAAAAQAAAKCQASWAIYLSRKGDARAIMHIEKACTIQENVYSHNTCASADNGLYDICFAAGEVYWNLEKYEKATEWYLRTAEILKHLTEHSDSMQHRRHLGLTYCILAALDEPNAIAYYKQADAIIGTMLNQIMVDDTICGLLPCYYNLGEHYIAKGYHQKAMEAYQKAILLYQKMKKREDALLLIREVYYGIAVLYETENKMAQAEEAYRHALAKNETIFIKSQDPEYLGASAAILNAIGRVCNAQAKHHDAMVAYRQAREKATTAAGPRNSPEIRRTLYTSISELGGILFFEGNHTEALPYLKEAKNMAESMYTDTSSKFYAEEWISLHYFVGICQEHCGNRKDALKNFENGFLVAKSRIHQIATQKTYDTLVYLYRALKKQPVSILRRMQYRKIMQEIKRSYPQFKDPVPPTD